MCSSVVYDLNCDIGAIVKKVHKKGMSKWNWSLFW